MATGNPEELELDQLARAELQRLQRQHRVMEEERQTYAEEVRAHTEAQRRQIAWLERERRQISLSPEMAQISATRRLASRSGRRLISTLEKQEDLEASLQTERHQIADLSLQISRVEREVAVLRRGGESEVSRREAVKAAERAERLLGDRLHHASIRFNSLLTENRRLRFELDHLVRERGRFNTLRGQLEERLAKGRKLTAELTEHATQAYDQREEAQGRLQALREQARGEAERHGADMSVLQRQLDSVSKLYNFLGTKGQRRSSAQLETQEALKQMSQREAQERLLQSYATSLEQVREFCGEQDASKLAALFAKQEEENFALFNYVNELNNELEVLEDQVESLRHAVEVQRGQQARRERQRESTRTELVAKRGELKAELVRATESLREEEDNMHELLDGLHTVFKLGHTDPAPILALLGEEADVTAASSALFLELLHERCCAILKQATAEPPSCSDGERSSIGGANQATQQLTSKQQNKRASFTANLKRTSTSREENQ